MAGPYQPLTDQDKTPQFHPFTNSSGVMPSGEGNFNNPFKSETQYLVNTNNYDPQPSSVLKGGPSDHGLDPLGTLPSILAPESKNYAGKYVSSRNPPGSGVINNEAAIIDTREGIQLNATTYGSPLSNSDIQAEVNFSQGNYIHYTPNPQGGEGMIDKVPNAIDFDPSITIRTNSTPYYRYGN